MKKLDWTKEYSVGNAEVDYDHMKLFEIYNKLADLTDAKFSVMRFAELLSELTDYSLYHFKKEEAYMEKMPYPDIDSHRKAHRDYILKVAFFNADLLGKNPPDVIDIMMFIEDWWKNHILRVDLRYELYKRTNQIETIY